MTVEEIPAGFEAAHTEWLRVGGSEFRETQRFGPRPGFYRSRYWKLVKEALLTVRNFKCCRCKGEATQAHHLNYEHVGEDHLHPEALAAVCTPCHGLVEYARLAESLMSKISRRISLCNGFLEGRRGCLRQSPAHVLARLFEYRDQLAELRNKFTTETHYNNPRLQSLAERDAALECFRQKRTAYAQQALSVISEWAGTEKEKAEQLLPMLRTEIESCKKFVAEVFAPVPVRVERISPARLAEVVAHNQEGPRSGFKAEFESLVVGTKYHRGHIDGVACGDSVQLVREPGNSFDPKAIQVRLETGEALGYLTRELAAVLADEIDAGTWVQSNVSRIVGQKLYVGISILKAKE